MLNSWLLERDAKKWAPVFRLKSRENKQSRALCDSFLSHIALGASSLLVCAAATPVLGQAGGQAADAAASAPQGGNDDGQIVVTAQRREALNKDVPIAVAVVSANTLANTTAIDSSSLQNVVPGLKMERQGVGLAPTIRGITTAVTFLSEPNVATYVDDVYQPSNFGGFTDLPDVRSVQVLKGPQGTLFGRNATGGAILISTRDPQFAPEGMVSLSYASYNDVIAKAFVTVPLIPDLLSASVTGYARRRDDYMTNVATGKKGDDDTSTLIRAKLRLQPAAGVNFILTGLYAKNHSASSAEYGNYKGNNPENGKIPYYLLATGPDQFSSDMHLYNETVTKSLDLRGTIEAGPGVITTTTSYINQQTPSYFDDDNTYLPLLPVFDIARSKAFSQEFLYTLKHIPRLNGTIGVFYYHNDSAYNPLYFVTTSIRTKDKDDSIGLFGELTYDLTDKFQLTGGLRYSYEKRTAAAGIADNVPVPDSGLFPIGKKSWSAVTPRASVLYRLNHETNLYVTYSEGFKSGLFNTYNFQATPVNPETLKAIEVGLKSAGHDYSFDLSGFHYDYRNIQTSTLQNGGITSTLQNAASARIWGVDFDATWKATHDLSFTLGGEYLDAKYRKFPNASLEIPIPATPLAAGQNPCDLNYTYAYTGNMAASCDVSGKSMVLAPKFSGSVVANYGVDTGLGRFGFVANAYYTSRFYFDSLDRLYQTPYVNVGARASWSPLKQSGLEVSVYVTNLTDVKIIATRNDTGFDWDRLQIGRQVGGEFKYSF